jgi:hypothetical protein
MPEANSSDLNKFTGGMKLSLNSALIAFICFFLPWVKACNMTLSGFDIIQHGPTEEFKAYGTIFLILVPICAVIIIYTILQVVKGQLDKRSANYRILIASIVPLVTLVIFFFWLKHRLNNAPIDIFTFWFFLTVIAFAVSALASYIDIQSSNSS